MNKIFKLLMVAAVGLFFVGCYNDYMNPKPAKVFSKDDFTAEGLTYISIKDLKQEFATDHLGSNIGAVASWTVDRPLFTSGKVISNDRFGNIYKTLYIYDEVSESTIEIKLNTGNYLFHPVGQMVYVKLEGLVLGNYRGMTSIGTTSYNAKYSNDNIETEILQNEHIFSGEVVPMLPSDTLVVNRSNYQTALNENSLGRLVRFEDVESIFGQSPWGYQNNFPNYFFNADNTFDVTSPGWTDIYSWATWATKRLLNGANSYFYGNFWFSYNDQVGSGSQNIPAGNYIVRTSGYSQFSGKKAPTNGTKVDMTAIYTRYCNGSGNYIVYQLSLNNDTDVIVK